MSRTATSINQQATEIILAGHAEFKVIAKNENVGPDNTMTRYLVATPFAATRSGIFGRLKDHMFDGNGQSTKFGDSVFFALNDLGGIECSLDNDTPHVIVLYVTSEAMAEGPVNDNRYRYAGMPASIATAIQVSIMRNRGPIQRFAEYLRRLF